MWTKVFFWSGQFFLSNLKHFLRDFYLKLKMLLKKMNSFLLTFISFKHLCLIYWKNLRDKYVYNKSVVKS